MIARLPKQCSKKVLAILKDIISTGSFCLSVKGVQFLSLPFQMGSLGEFVSAFTSGLS